MSKEGRGRKLSLLSIRSIPRRPFLILALESGHGSHNRRYQSSHQIWNFGRFAIGRSWNV